MSLINPISEKEHEHPHCHLIQFLCFISFFPIWFLDSFIITYSVVQTSLIPLIIRLAIFSILILISFILSRSLHNIVLSNDQSMIQKSRKHHLPDKVIDYGIMAYVRHPLYLAILMFYFAFVLLTMSIVSFLVWTIIFFIYNRMASFEEKQLILLFNEDYTHYKERVPKWIPNPITFIKR